MPVPAGPMPKVMSWRQHLAQVLHLVGRAAAQVGVARVQHDGAVGVGRQRRGAAARGAAASASASCSARSPMGAAAPLVQRVAAAPRRARTARARPVDAEGCRRAAPGARPARPRCAQVLVERRRTGGPGGGCRRGRRCGGGSRQACGPDCAAARARIVAAPAMSRATAAAGRLLHNRRLHARRLACRACCAALACCVAGAAACAAGAAPRRRRWRIDAARWRRRRRRRRPSRLDAAGAPRGAARRLGAHAARLGGTVWYRVRFDAPAAPSRRRTAGAVRRARLQQPRGLPQRPARAQRRPHDRAAHAQLQPPAAGAAAGGAARARAATCSTSRSPATRWPRSARASAPAGCRRWRSARRRCWPRGMPGSTALQRHGCRRRWAPRCC